MFCKTPEDNPGLCRELLALALGRPVGELVSVNRQKPIEITADGRPSDKFTNKLENAVLKARDHLKWRQAYMTFLEQIEKAEERGRAEERVNTERERQRADAAKVRSEAAFIEITELKSEMKKLKELLAAKKQT